MECLNNFWESYFDFTSSELSNDFLWWLFIDGASYWEAGSQDLLDGTGEVLGHGFFFNDFGDFLDLLESEISFVGDVFDFFSVSFIVAEFLDDEGWWGGVNDDFSGSVLTLKLNHNSNTFPFSSFFNDILSDLLGILYKWSYLRDPRDRAWGRGWQLDRVLLRKPWC